MDNSNIWTQDFFWPIFIFCPHEKLFKEEEEDDDEEEKEDDEEEEEEEEALHLKISIK